MTINLMMAKAMIMTNDEAEVNALTPSIQRETGLSRLNTIKASGGDANDK